MLFTRCPDCDTTFRVTDDALTKANGQVRCGRCASVFNAYAERRDPPPDIEDPEVDGSEVGDGETPLDDDFDEPLEYGPALPAVTPEWPLDAEAPPSAGEVAANAAPTPALASAELATPAPPAAANSEPLTLANVIVAAAAQPPLREAIVELAPDAQSPALGRPAKELDPLAVAEIVAGTIDAEPAVTAAIGADAAAVGAADGVASPTEPATPGDASNVDPDSISPSQVNRVLETPETLLQTWHLPNDSAESRPRARVWIAASAVAMVTLAAQALHHFRGDLATNDSIGNAVQRTYALFGADVVPTWNVEQYEIIDWIAAAEPSARGAGSLRITARIKNRGPLRQPYPSIHLQLKDRWEEAVGSRVFAPTEYLATAPRRLMAPGETTRAELAIVDPGQDAYGFELDVCVEIETHELSCGSDKVFR